MNRRSSLVAAFISCVSIGGCALSTDPASEEASVSTQAAPLQALTTTPSGANLSGAITVPGTGGWQTYTTITANVTLPAGQQVIELFEDTGGYNLNYMTF